VKTQLELSQYKIIRHNKSCSCGGSSGTVRYVLPSKLTVEIVTMLSPLGKTCLDFNKIGMFKIENQNYLIMGLKGTNVVTFYEKNENHPEFKDQLEDILIKFSCS
jgi:hypothetical protein